MKLFRTLIALTLLGAAGCRSHVIKVIVVNSSPQPVSTIIVDYPDATYGVNSLAPGQSFPYFIKPMGTGALKVQFVNAQGVSHSASGPTLHKGEEGAIQIRLSQDSAAFF